MTGLPLRVGVIGCGNISDVYFRNASLFSEDFRISACADLNAGAAQAKAAAWGISAVSPEELLADPDIDVVLNLTIPAAHFAVTAAALEAGKHVYSEKPLALSIDDVDRLVLLADAHGLQVACAPDTILGAAVQSARAAIERGEIGKVVGVTAAIMDRGMEDWHPNPGFFFQPGGGPVMDMGPYYLATLIELMGPVSEVRSMASVGLQDRRIGTGEHAGQPIEIAVATSVRALLRFASGADAVFIGSWDVWRHSLPHVEVYGAEGTISLPDPNWFGNAPMISRQGQAPVPLDLSGFAFGEPNRKLSDGSAVADYRGLGMSDLCRAIAESRPPRLGLPFARHCTEVLLRIAEGEGGQQVE